MDTAEESYPKNQKSSLETASQGGMASAEKLVAHLNYQILVLTDPAPKDHLHGIYCTLQSLIKTGESRFMESVLVLLAKLFKKGHSAAFLQHPQSLKLLIRYYNTLANKLEHSETPVRRRADSREPLPASQIEFQMLGVLSLCSHLLNEHPELEFPFCKRFVQNVFMLSSQLIAISQKKAEITRVLSVILLALSKKPKALKDFGLVSHFKQVLLESYSLVDDQRSFFRFNKAIKNLMLFASITLADTKKHKLLDVLGKFLKPTAFAEVFGSWKLSSGSKEQCKNVMDISKTEMEGNSGRDTLEGR